jgi:hypothetical protein
MTQMEVNDFNSKVTAVDSDSLLTPQTMDKIVRVVLQAVDEQEAHRQRVRAEQRITRGVSYELEETA